MDSNVVYIQNEQKGVTIGDIAGLAVGACVFIAARGMLDTILPESLTTLDKVVRMGALYGGSVAVSSAAADSVADRVDSILTIPSLLANQYNKSKAQVANLTQQAQA